MSNQSTPQTATVARGLPQGRTGTHEIDQKFALRAYTIGEIDALRYAITASLHTGFYRASVMEILESSNNLTQAEEAVIVEERLRTALIAGLTAADCVDVRKSGHALECLSDGGVVRWWNRIESRWQTDITQDCLFGMDVEITNAVYPHMCHFKSEKYPPTPVPVVDGDILSHQMFKLDAHGCLQPVGDGRPVCYPFYTPK